MLGGGKHIFRLHFSIVMKNLFNDYKFVLSWFSALQLWLIVFFWGIVNNIYFDILAKRLNMISPSDLQALFAKVEGTTVPVDLLRVGQSIAYGILII